VAVGVFWVLAKLIDFVSSLISVSPPITKFFACAVTARKASLIAIFPRANATRTGLPSSLLRCLTCNILALHLHAAFVFLSCIHSGISATFVDLVACPAFSLGPTAVPSVAASPTLSQATLIFSALFTTRNCQRWQYINCTALCQPHIALLHSSVCSRYNLLPFK
jgi:hypothetical protein